MRLSLLVAVLTLSAAHASAQCSLRDGSYNCVSTSTVSTVRAFDSALSVIGVSNGMIAFTSDADFCGTALNSDGECLVEISDEAGLVVAMLTFPRDVRRHAFAFYISDAQERRLLSAQRITVTVALDAVVHTITFDASAGGVK